ncbi:shikimate dehydrogenase [Candidatus Omnitrophota bacterium]
MAEEKKKIFGLIGYPLGHSLSPQMHNAAFKALNLNAEYQLFPLKPEELSHFIERLQERNIHGFNVTVPYKEEILKYLQWKSFDAHSIGAVNTVRVLNGNYLKGYNTDAWGFFTHLKSDLLFDPKDKIISVLGAGGAAKAVCFILAQKGAQKISVYDIDQGKTQVLVDMIHRLFSRCETKAAHSIEELDIKQSHLLVNATPIGLKEDDPCIVGPEYFHTDILVYDLIYNPVETKLLRMAKERKAPTSNGLGMLFYQGTAACERFTDTKLNNYIRNEMWRSLFT